MPIRQGGILASRASTWPRDHFCRSTMAPRISWPTTWNEFLPISMPITTIAVLGVSDMACSLSLAPLASFAGWRGRSTAGPSHYRTLRAVRPRATGGPILTFPSLHRSLELQGTRMAYDYVLAGGGSAGATLAARLSEDPKITVCLIEAGGEGRSVVVRAPIGVAAMLSGKPKINNWAFETVPQPGLNGRRGYQPRGKALGGSSAINGMIYIRGHHTDYDDWAALGCEGWSWKEVLPYFKRAEGNERGADVFHGGDGPLRVANQRSPRPIASAFVEACAENQIRRNNDFNGPEQEGAGLYQVTQFWGGHSNGERCSTAAAYLHPVMNRPNLTVITNAQVTGIVFDGKRATGLRYRRDGRDKAAEARREVMLCGGTFGSPQLLLLSGVGPADELK